MIISDLGSAWTGIEGGGKGVERMGILCRMDQTLTGANNPWKAIFA